MNQNIRLPKTAVPNRYEINLDINLNQFNYRGKEIVFLEVVDETKELQLHALGIDIKSVFIENDSGEHIDASVDYLPEEEKISLIFENEITKGDWQLYLEFEAEIVDELRGFYRSSFKDKDDKDVWIATTQFEPTAARMAFPCWDEPEFKAVFSISLTTDSELIRISNEKVLSESSENNRTTTKFVDSMRMSTYLVAFVIGPLEVTKIGKSETTEVGIVHRPGFSDQTAYAGAAAIKILDFFEEYYGINYPGSKLDLIAVPDFAMGAMENVGAVTFRETLLLIDVEKATRSELSRSVSVIAHELAHMWFGDLVTMNWWDGIWLNEAFASLMEVIASEATYPEFKLWNEMNQDRSRGFGVDSLKSSRPVEFEVKSPEEAEEMFDVLTYQKGSTVLRMFETFIGEENFKEGVRSYLKKYEYKNTHSSDLWNELTNSSSYNLSDILPTWIKQEGYPIVKIEKEGSNFKVSQKKYLIDGDTDDSLWSVPLNIRCLDSGVTSKEVITSKSHVIEVDGEVPFINNGGWSFFHSSYSEELFEMIISNFEKLDVNEKYRILEDSWMALRTGELSLKLFMKLLNLYANEEEINIWSYISSIFSTFAKIDNREEFKNYVKEFIYPLIERLGLNYNSEFNQEESQLKSLLCGTYANITEDSNFINHFSDQFNSNSYEDYVDGNYFNLVLYIAGMNKENLSDKYIEKLKNAKSPQIEARYRNVIGTLSDPNAPKKVINAILDQSIRGADAPYIIATLLSNTKNASVAFQEIKNNWSNLLNVMPGWTSSRILDSLSSIYDESLSLEIKKFIKDNPLPSADKITKQKIERMDANIKFKNSIKEDLNNTKFKL